MYLRIEVSNRMQQGCDSRALQAVTLIAFA